jgi:phage terminase large subunit
VAQAATRKIEINIDLIEAFVPLLEPHRYKVYYGGRGGAKSWEFADALILRSLCGQELILCTREYQSSIADSVYRLLLSRISALGLNECFRATLNSIKSINGSEFIFKGLHHNIMEIKSLEGVTICWVEEAQSVSGESWEVLIPTIRRANSEIWISFNTGEEDDPTYVRFVKNPPPDSVVRKVGWQDNPFFPEVLNKERLYLKSVDPEAYEHIWEGFPKKISEACIFRDKYTVRSFETPEGVRFYYGADWGFSQDPTVLMRCFIRDNKLFIDYEAYGIGVDLDDIPALFDQVPEARKWIIRADNSRPETIRHIKKKDSGLSLPSRSGARPMSRTSPERSSRCRPGQASRMALPISGGSRRSSSMNAASTWPTRPSSIPIRSTSSQRTCCRSLSMPGTTALWAEQ